MYNYHDKEITKEDYEKINSGEKNVYDFFSDAAVMGYGLSAHQPYEKEGRYFIPYYMGSSCD